MCIRDRPKSEQTGWVKRKEMVKDAKDKPCAICKVKYDPCVMDLHHLDPSKKDGMISHFMKSGSYQSLQEEIDKCVPLCSNCHRLLHNGLATLASMAESVDAPDLKSVGHYARGSSSLPTRTI